jgi:hypothetical protein
MARSLSRAGMVALMALDYVGHMYFGLVLLTTAVPFYTLYSVDQQSALCLFMLVHVYEKLGYRKVGERLWVDLGTGIRPLTTESEE